MTEDLDCSIPGRGTIDETANAGRCPDLARHGLAAIGLVTPGAGHRVVRRSPPFAHLSVCVAGSGQALIDGRWQRTNAGEALLHPADHPHGSACVRAASGWSFAWVVFSDPRRLGAARRHGRAHADGALWSLVVRALCHSARSGERATAPALCDALAALIADVARPRPDQSRLAALWQRVDRDLAHPWTMPGLAEVAGVGPRQLARMCAAVHGHPPRLELAQRRLDRAASLLRTTTLSVGAVAEAVGYANPFSFSTAFARMFGSSPAHWRATLGSG